MSDKNYIDSGARHQFYPSALSSSQRQLIRSLVESTGQVELEHRIATFRLHARNYVEAAEKNAEVDNLRVAVALSILADLVGQGWLVGTTEHGVYVEAASFDQAEGETVDHAKSRIRKGLQIASNQKLAEQSVQEFLRHMERHRSFNGRTVSIATLIDDGAQLAAKFRELQLDNEGDCGERVGKFIRPVLQECVADGRCSETGFKLQDIWRYFRYTWSLEYNPLPGRTQRFLVRNAARKHKPVIGIAMLASPTANLGSRDEWIGWQFDQLTTRILDGSLDARFVATKLVDALRLSVTEIRSDDLLSADELAQPDFNTLLRLEQIAAQASAQRSSDLSHKVDGVLVDIRDVGKSKLTDDDWFALSNTSLFRKKRAEQLIPVLRALEVLQDYGVSKEPATALYVALTEKAGQSAVRVALNEIKKRHLSSEVADLAVCGAIAPYNIILGGKLVALLMASREARQSYKDRYEGQVSEIASQIAGRAVSKSSDLKLITTTSLYGVGSNQYTRLALKRTAFPNMTSDVVWQKLRRGQGVSITHISEETVALMRKLGIAAHGRRRINSVFGEGSSPRMRQVREGLNLIGINDDSLLKQSHGRKVYGCELYEGARDDVLGLAKGGRNRASSSVRQISSAWAQRWLVPRIQKQSVLEELEASGAAKVQKELRSRSSQGERLNQDQPSEKDEEARASVISILEATETSSAEAVSTDLITASAPSST
jgi:hypothetical protein